MKYKCVKEFMLEKCDENCFPVENEVGYVLEGSIWETCDYDFIGGEVHLGLIDGCDDFGWIEISRDKLRDCFVEVEE